MPNKIPAFDLKDQYQQIAPDLEPAILGVLRSGHYILGENGTLLEKEIAALCGCRHGIGVANCTDALNLALWSLDIGLGDEVITTPFTFAATVEAIALRGAKPIFVDIDEATYNIDIKLIEAAITSKTKAIMPVHLFGLPAEMDPILELAKQYSLKVIEDNAQAIGAMYKGRPTGGLGDVACISFYPTKNLGACGDAGMLVTNDDALADRLRRLRAHGMKKRYYHDELGVNSRLDEIQAVVLLSKLRYLNDWNARRRQIAQLYDKDLQGCSGIALPQIPNTPSALPKTEHVWHQYTIQIGNYQSNLRKPSTASTVRDTVMAKLSERGIGSMCYYPVPLHLQAAFLHYGYRLGDFPKAERLAQEVISLPMYPELTDAQVRTVVSALKEIIAELNNTPVGDLSKAQLQPVPIT